MKIIDSIFSLYKDTFATASDNRLTLQIPLNNLQAQQALHTVAKQIETVNQFDTSPSPAKPATDKKAAISILGLGYVGAVSTACFAQLGHKVTGVDPDLSKVEKVNSGESPVVETGLGKLLKQGFNKHKVSATSDVFIAVLTTDITLVSVGTPSDEQGACDLTYLKAAAKQIGKALKEKQGYHCVIFRSTVPPGTTLNELKPVIEQYSGKLCGADFGLCFNPEFLRESTAIEDFFAPPKTVIGAYDQRSAMIASALYRDISDQLFITDLAAAEFVKYIDNTWHALKVCFGNEIGRLCSAMDVDSHKVMDIFCADSKLNISPYYLKPGFAFGGSCLPKDTKGMIHLADSLSVDTPIINKILASNQQHLHHAFNLIKATRAHSIGFVGLTFKANTDDLRDSPAIALLDMLDKEDFNISYLDNKVDEQALIKQGLSWHISSNSCDNAFTLIERNELLIIANHYTNAAKIVERAINIMPVIDLVGLSLPDGIKQHKNYIGLCW